MPGSCQRPDVLALRILVRPVKMNSGPAMIVRFRPILLKKSASERAAFRQLRDRSIFGVAT